MCGRHAYFIELSKLTNEFNIVKIVTKAADSYNIAPTDPVNTIVDGKLYAFRWGLIPHWVTDLKEFNHGKPVINARAETIRSNGMFRDSFQSKRCIVPSSGYFEWQKTSGGKQPYFFYHNDGSLMAYAALFDIWTDANGKRLYSVTIVTTEANQDTRFVHSRMPVVLNKEFRQLWLNNKEYHPDQLTDLFNSDNYEAISSHKVSSLVGSVKNNSAELVARSPD